MKKTAKKTKTGKPSRSKVKYPGLDPAYNLRSRQEEITDIASYAHKLTEEEKAWANAFVEEEINANFKHKGIKINRKVADKRRCYTKNNARNRDILNRAKLTNSLVYLDDLLTSEDQMNEILAKSGIVPDPDDKTNG